jgi:hypothetical protein
MNNKETTKAAQCFFVMSTNGAVSEYESFETLFSFYPGGIKGLIAEYILLYLSSSYPSDKDEERWCTAGEDTVEGQLLIKVMDLYERSWDYTSKQLAYPNCQQEFTIELVCEEISKKLYHAIKENQAYFLFLQPTLEKDVLFAGDIAAIKMTYTSGKLL